MGDLTFAHSTHPDVIVVEDDPQTTKRVYKAGVIPEVPDWVPAIAGDVAHNLRASLDLLVGQLIVAEGGTIKGADFHFPISDTRQKFEANCKTTVKGCVGKNAYKLICATEAYRGGNGDSLWRVHRLDIEDKHRLLFVVGFGYRSFSVTWPRGVFSPEGERMLESVDVFLRPADRQVPLKEGDELFIDPNRTEPKTEPKFRLDVAFSEFEIVEGEPVLPTLLRFTEEVERTVEAFASELP